MSLATPTDLEVSPSSYSTLRVSWAAAPGATHYMILYSALNHGEPEDAKEVLSLAHARLCVCECVCRAGAFFYLPPLQERFGAEQTAVELQELLPATDYSVTLYALYDEEPSDPVTAAAATCKHTLHFNSSPLPATIG